MGLRKIVLLSLPLMAMPSFAESGLHAMAITLAGQIPGMHQARRAKPDEFPEVLHILGFDTDGRSLDDKLEKCSGTAFGRCVISAAHCFEKVPARMKVKGETGFEAAIDLSRIRLFHGNSYSNTDGNDLAIVRLDKVPPKYLAPDELALPEDIVFPELPHWLDDTTAKRSGVPVQAVGYGTDYDEDAQHEAVANASYNERGAVMAGALFHDHKEMTHPHRQVGTLRVLGPFWQLAMRDALKKLDDAQHELESAGAFSRWLHGRSRAEALARIERSRREIQKDASLLAIPDPSYPDGGDSGGALFLQSSRGRVLLGVTTGAANPKKRSALYSVSSDNLARAAIERRASLYTPITGEEQRQWLIEQYRALGCATSSGGLEAMPG